MPKSKITSATWTVEEDDGSEREVTQYSTTPPKSLVEAMNLDGATIEWEVKSADSLKVSVIARGDEE